MDFELPIMITKNGDAFRIAVMLNESVVVSRAISRADLVQLQVRIDAAINEEGLAEDVSEMENIWEDSSIFS